MNSDSSEGADSDEDDVKLINKIKHRNDYIKYATIGKVKRSLEIYMNR